MKKVGLIASHVEPSLDATLNQIIDAKVEERVDARLRQMGLKGAEYTTKHPAPNVRPRTFNLWCRSGRVEGAEPDGRGWRCSVEAWRKARAVGRKRAAVPVAVIANDDALVAEMLRTSRRSA